MGAAILVVGVIRCSTTYTVVVQGASVAILKRNIPFIGLLLYPKVISIVKNF